MFLRLLRPVVGLTFLLTTVSTSSAQLASAFGTTASAFEVSPSNIPKFFVLTVPGSDLTFQVHQR
jgi:hypothetical protein